MQKKKIRLTAKESGKIAWHGMKSILKFSSLLQIFLTAYGSARCDEFLLKAEGNFSTACKLGGILLRGKGSASFWNICRRKVRKRFSLRGLREKFKKIREELG